MKAFTNSKILTGVVVIFFACLSWGQDSSESYEKCVRRNKSLSSVVDSCKEKLKSDSSDGKYSSADLDRCIAGKAEENCEGSPTKSDSNDLKQRCESAMDKYSEAAAKSNEACAAFDQSGGKSCKDKAASCDKKIKSLSNPFGSSDEDPSDDDSGYGALKQVALTSIYQQMGIANTQNGTIAGQGGACVKSIDRKARAQDKKDKDRERKDLQEKIKQQKDKIVDYKEDLDKERNDNSEKVAELDAENKKEVLAKDKSISDETAKVSKDVVEIGKRLRNYSLAITKEMQNLASTNFEYQTAMLDLTDEKVNQRCKQEFESLKAGIVNSKVGGAPAGASAEEQKQYAALAALAAQYKSQGIKGSGELKNMLIAARKACYERANTSRNKNKLVNSQAVKNIQDKIDEYKNLMADEKNGITTAQKNLETQKSQIDKEKQQAESEKLTKLDNLSKKLANQISNSEQKTKNANDKIKELTAEINNLALVQNFEVEDAFSEATEAMDKGEFARVRAVAACNCADKPVDTDICSKLNTAQQKYDGTAIKKKSAVKKAQ